MIRTDEQNARDDGKHSYATLSSPKLMTTLLLVGLMGPGEQHSPGLECHLREKKPFTFFPMA